MDIFNVRSQHSLFLYVFSVFCVGLFYTLHSRRPFELPFINTGLFIADVSSTASSIWHASASLLRRTSGSSPTAQIVGFLKHALQYLESRLFPTSTSVESHFVSVSHVDGRHVVKQHHRRRTLSVIHEEPVPPTPAVSSATLVALDLCCSSERRKVGISASSSGPSTFEPHLPAERQATLTADYFDSDTFEKSRSPVSYPSDAWKRGGDASDALALVVWRGGGLGACIPPIGRVDISQDVTVSHVWKSTLPSSWSQQYHLHDIFRDSERQHVLDLSANNFPPEWVTNVMKTKARSSTPDASVGIDHRAAQQQIDRRNRSFTEPQFPSIPFVFGDGAGSQPLPAFQSLESMVRYLDLCVRRPPSRRTFHKASQQLSEVDEHAGLGNVLMLATRTELRKTKSTDDVRKRWFGPRAFLVFSHSTSQP